MDCFDHYQPGVYHQRFSSGSGRKAGKVIAAGYWGKIKTAVTMVTIVFMIPNFGGIFSGASWIYPLEQVLVYASLILTIISLIDYLVKNKEVLGGEM